MLVLIAYRPYWACRQLEGHTMLCPYCAWHFTFSRVTLCITNQRGSPAFNLLFFFFFLRYLCLSSTVAWAISLSHTSSFSLLLSSLLLSHTRNNRFILPFNLCTLNTCLPWEWLPSDFPYVAAASLLASPGIAKTYSTGWLLCSMQKTSIPYLPSATLGNFPLHYFN